MTIIWCWFLPCCEQRYLGLWLASFCIYLSQVQSCSVACRVSWWQFWNCEWLLTGFISTQRATGGYAGSGSDWVPDVFVRSALFADLCTDLIFGRHAFWHPDGLALRVYRDLSDRHWYWGAKQEKVRLWWWWWFVSWLANCLITLYDDDDRSAPEVQQSLEMLKEKYAGKKLIVARDKLDYIKGVRQKLLAFEQFLLQHPEWRGKV